MRNRIIGFAAATALGLSSFAATPAYADRNLQNFLLAAGAIMIVAGITANRQSEARHRHGVVVERTRVVSPARHCEMHRRGIPHRHPGRGVHGHRPHHHHHHRHHGHHRHRGGC
ncbi:hypothetical protein SAMN05216257_101365 [Meinhardsimonia xiamenensis]|jgi:hypothetical protein|uniref:Uncharacterized protein n=1 Tax=Meinhardsimonia xiamenensis TaxID=990712 RepID=A0A1G8YLP7_9RHOB|nr:hypothetical protein [Meinhardsimonia xiamenensis]PRX37342.1 hypothetical protein LV81_01120 [Meinhardsimonia xiamenensis]SDK03394.1 hypothetical protein SAMN05216257_101365 [Meinhardsimonia xiamenensis]